MRPTKKQLVVLPVIILPQLIASFGFLSLQRFVFDEVYNISSAHLSTSNVAALKGGF